MQKVLGHGFYGSIAKRRLQNSAKIIQKFTIRPTWAVAPSSPWIRHCVRVVERPRCFWVCRTMHHKSLGLGSRRMASLIDSCYSTSKNSQTSHEWVGHCAWLTDSNQINAAWGERARLRCRSVLLSLDTAVVVAAAGGADALSYHPTCCMLTESSDRFLNPS